jgi:glycosyltransferase involved in cell wall biosynthesis
LADRVHFVGYVPPAEVANYYRTASVALFSSVWPEPFGLAGLEALHYGLPVVAFDAGGVREWLDDGINGLLAPWMDRKEFARRIDVLLADRALAQRLGEQGRVLVRERFSFPRYIRELEQLFLRLIAGSAQEVGP